MSAASKACQQLVMLAKHCSEQLRFPSYLHSEYVAVDVFSVSGHLQRVPEELSSGSKDRQDDACKVCVSAALVTHVSRQ